ncbi:hypothetical protein ABT352_33095 [Streptosporangium sp. NPDC000563]|uniref:hypothetical protein n=1 Tax=Streptosporangium sp. NPDC000563 TaxID=3154366 RepID=UPI003322D615
MKHAIRDRLVATECQTVNRYLAAGLDQRKARLGLIEAQRDVKQAGEFHDRRGSAVSEQRLQRVIGRWQEARHANRAAKTCVANLQAMAQSEDPRAADLVTRELVVVWAEFEARREAYADA